LGSAADPERILESTRFAGGLKNHDMLEFNGKQGSLHFDLKHMHEQYDFLVCEQPKATQGLYGFIRY